jgi:hypothetical protein
VEVVNLCTVKSARSMAAEASILSGLIACEFVSLFYAAE